MVAYHFADPSPYLHRTRDRLSTDAARHVVAELAVPEVPIVEGRSWWPPVATAAWLEQAARCGIAATDCTAEVIDWIRDSDDSYAGSVRVGRDIVDLIVDGDGVRVGAEDRYLI